MLRATSTWDRVANFDWLFDNRMMNKDYGRIA